LRASCPDLIRVYNGTKSFINSVSFALGEELKDTGITVSRLTPGPTDTELCRRADLIDTNVGQAKKDDPGEVTKVGFDAMVDGEGDVVSGWDIKLQAAVATVTPANVLSHQLDRGILFSGIPRSWSAKL
jgi:short-subunit dehydrogenase